MFTVGKVDVSQGPLAQSAERGADNAKVVSSTLTRTMINDVFVFVFFFLLSFILLFYFNQA